MVTDTRDPPDSTTRQAPDHSSLVNQNKGLWKYVFCILRGKKLTICKKFRNWLSLRIGDMRRVVVGFATDVVDMDMAMHDGVSIIRNQWRQEERIPAGSQGCQYWQSAVLVVTPAPIIITSTAILSSAQLGLDTKLLADTAPWLSDCSLALLASCFLWQHHSLLSIFTHGCHKTVWPVWLLRWWQDAGWLWWQEQLIRPSSSPHIQVRLGAVQRVGADPVLDSGHWCDYSDMFPHRRRGQRGTAATSQEVAYYIAR